VTVNDNWGSLARIGLFIVGNEVVPEAEWWAMAPPHVSVHAARVSAATPWAQWREGRHGVVLQDDLLRGGRQFAAMALSAVVVGHSSSSLAGGKGWDEAVVAAFADILPPEMTVTTNGLDCMAALRASGANRPFLVLPPWFGDDTLAAADRYYRDHGFDPAGHYRYAPGGKWQAIPPRALYRHGMACAQETAPLQAQILAHCPDTADSVLIAGTGFRCVGILDALEQALGRPVLSANQASLWRGLRLSGVAAAIPGYGNLLRL
jgi:maleate isomerase